jgi:hypothetical protein
VTLPNGDYVQGAPPCAAEFRRNLPVMQTEALQALKPAEQKQLIKSGLIKIEPQWGRASGGRVRSVWKVFRHSGLANAVGRAHQTATVLPRISCT